MKAGIRKALPGARRLWPLWTHALAWHYCDPHRAPPAGLCVFRLLPSGRFFQYLFSENKSQMEEGFCLKTMCRLHDKMRTKKREN